MAIGDIINGEGGDKCLTIDLVGKAKVMMEANAWLKVFCGEN